MRLVDAVGGALWGVVVLMGVAFLWGAEIETALAPVARDFTIADRVDNDNGTIAIRIGATRLRSCDRIDSDWYAQGNDGRWYLAPTVRPPDDLPVNRPVGMQASQWNVLPGPGVYALRVQYRCHPLWPTPLTMGPFDVR